MKKSHRTVVAVLGGSDASAVSGKASPTCVFCGRSGMGVMFNIFTPRFKPFGTACVDCEDSLPPATLPPTAGRAAIRQHAAEHREGGAL